MKEIGKRTITLLLTMILILSSLGGVVNIASADGEPFEPMDGYTLVLGKDGAMSYAYFSPFVPKLTYNGIEVNGYSILFGLKDTYNDRILEIAYCTDLPVSDSDGAKYEPLNLTDSTYAATHADKLRAIVLNSYPYLTLEKLQENSGISGLSVYEAITGTQLAIWKAAHGDTVQIKDFMSWTISSQNNSGNGHKDLTKKEYDAYNNGTDEYKAAVKARIEALYDYLMALPEQSATQIVVSKASFVKRSETPTVTTNDDGTCNVTVKAKINNPGAELKLTAYMDSDKHYYTTISNVSSGEYELTIENVPAAIAGGAVTLSLDGTQKLGGDVYLLDAEGIRGTSQSMIAPLSGTQKVHAEIKCEPDRVLEIYKTSGENPLANISFEIYYVGSLEDYLSGNLKINTKPSETEIQKYAVTSKLVGTITTNPSGHGSLNFGTDDGVYLVKELPNELVESGVAFFVALPDYSHYENGNPSYTITASPKNNLKNEKVEIEKDVTELNNEHDTFDIGEEHTWIIQSSIPAAIGIAKAYEITDTLDTRLTLVSIDKVALAKDKGTFGNSEAVGYEKDEKETPLNEETVILKKDKDYTVTIGKTESGADTFKVALTSAGMRTVANAIATGTADTALNELRVYFKAKINETAAMGEKIPNQAHVKYTNNLDRDYSANSDQPEVYTGGTIVYKKSSTSAKFLPGATFEVYRDAKENEQETQTIVIGGEEKKVVKVSFYNMETIENNQQKVDSVTTDENGVAYIYGLAYGTYYLVETQAPAGYNKLNDPISFEINATSHEIDTTGKGGITVVNVPGVELPETGGTGTKAYAIGGWMLIGAAMLMLARKKRVA